MTETNVPSAARLPRLPVAALGGSVAVIRMLLSVFGIVPASAETLGLTRPQTMSLVIALHGLSAVMRLALTALYRQPLMAACNFSGLLLLASAAGQYGYREISGSVLVAGILGTLSWRIWVALLGAGNRDGRDSDPRTGRASCYPSSRRPSLKDTDVPSATRGCRLLSRRRANSCDSAYSTSRADVGSLYPALALDSR